jgi:hypothetical protein
VAGQFWREIAVISASDWEKPAANRVIRVTIPDLGQPPSSADPEEAALNLANRTAIPA